MMTRASSLSADSRPWICSIPHRFVWSSCLLGVVLAAGPSIAKQNADRPSGAPIFVLSESSQGSDDVAKTVATALGNPADLRRWTLTFSNQMEPGIRLYANGHDLKPVLDRLGAAGLKAAVIQTPIGVPYSVLTSSKDRIFLIIGPTP